MARRDPPDTSPAIRPELTDWLTHFRLRLMATDGKKKRPVKVPHTLAYVLVWSARMQRFNVVLYKATRGPDGCVRTIGGSWDNVEKALLTPPQFISEEDLVILRLLWLCRSRHDIGYSLSGTTGAVLLEKMLGTGRLFPATDTGMPVGNALSPGIPRPGKLQWQPDADNLLRPDLQTQPRADKVIAIDPLWYVDQATGEAGLVTLPWDAACMIDYLTMPPITQSEAPVVAAVLREIAPHFSAPPVDDLATIRIIDTAPVPVLELDTRAIYNMHNMHFGHLDTSSKVLDYATMHFNYNGFVVAPRDSTSLLQGPDGTLVQIRRQRTVESACADRLRAAGLAQIPSDAIINSYKLPPLVWGLASPQAWPQFMAQGAPLLRSEGWRIEMQPDFRFNIIDIETIDGQVHAGADGWFDLALGIVVGDRTVRLESLLAELFHRDPRWLGGGLATIPDDEAVELTTDRHELLRLRADRLKPVVRVLIDLFDGLSPGATLRIPRIDAGRLEALADTGRWQFHGDDTIRQLAQRLQGSTGIGAVPPPDTLRAALRSYQQQGLNWMQFLREHDLSGVLADDMGLGKTVQALAHLLVEQAAGRLDRPALVVVPTSLIHNWCDEAARFAPTLRVLSLHGSTRRDRFEAIGAHDLVLTTYALLWRDHAQLAQHAYHLLILDEAQFVKNASTRAAAAIRDLDARHRLCLTGTPLENHLGELWSLFDFLLPGFLGSSRDFTKRWRTPIEKNGDSVRRDLLACRIRPFMLRRRKDEVARELPPKTLIMQQVDLEGGQRDLYETVRTAMHEKVATAIAAQGLERSHIIVLDALLKLRQVCCDPRLVKLDHAHGVKESAKLSTLLSMLPELIEAGRRILLFSQFTGMLTLIAAAVEKAGIAYALLTGDTLDRATPVRRFQSGEIPLFLISLKAGGVGLNLTAADTVIHYDPWWNPAAENQATDRAHRLGQDKPVFVYKLIIAGSIEEKIVAMQEKKAALASGILSEDSATAVKFSDADLAALFAPLPLT